MTLIMVPAPRDGDHERHILEGMADSVDPPPTSDRGAGHGSDELSSGPPRAPLRSPGWLTGLVGVVVLSAAAAYAVHSSTGDADPPPTHHSQPRRTPLPDPAAEPYGTLPQLGPNPMGEDYPLAVGSVCTRTDHVHTLSVGFDLSNVAHGRVRVLSVSPSLPIGGLRPTGVTVPGGRPCPGLPVGRGMALDRAEHVTIRLHFRLPHKCPKPYPVGAFIEVREGNRIATQRILLLSDLGQLSFRSCRS
jgi:hypothetical protein